MSAVCHRKLPGTRRECRTVLSFSTNGLGAVDVHCHRCSWQQAGRCWQCGAARQNHPTHGTYCEACTETRRTTAKYERSDRAKRTARKRDRERNRTPERKAWRKAWVAAHPDRVKRWKRKAALNPTPRKRERERYHNSRPERIEAKRAQARARYYEQHPQRPAPTCRSCETPIPWSPPGRPPVRCDACVPASVRRKRKRSQASVSVDMPVQPQPERGVP
jgi:hypothetical protein